MNRVREPAQKQALVMRLKRIEGQLRGIQRLIDDEAECASIVQQLSAARRALDKTHHSLLGCMIEAGLREHGLGRAEVQPVVDILARFG
jgi:DNA-binding FrmR family transcriptional regulator